MTSTEDPTTMTLAQLRAELLTEYGFGSRLKLPQARAQVVKQRQLTEAGRLAAGDTAMAR